MEYRKLTPEEKRIIIDKGTEMPFTGKYLKNTKKGTYHCRQCGALLYRSEDKFKSGCGWPSFDDEIKGAIKKETDKDGRRTEILCAKCNGHLGHVFHGEGFTPKNTRHCVNSASLDFKPSQSETAFFAAGCFWGVEHLLKQEKGVLSTTVGYIGGNKENPSYKDVCHKDTGHAEAVKVEFNPTETSFETLAKLFFEMHDFSQIDRQGPDVGNQYRSEIFTTNEQQKEIAQKLIKFLESKGYKVATKISPAPKFWDAENYHQDYYTKTGKAPYCHIRRKKF